MKLKKEFGGVFPLDLDDGQGDRLVDAFEAYEHLGVIGRRVKADKKISDKDEVPAKVVYPLAAATFFDQPAGDWPFPRAAAFWEMVLEAKDAAKKSMTD